MGSWNSATPKPAATLYNIFYGKTNKEAAMKSGRQFIHACLLCHTYGSAHCSGHLRKRIASKETAIGHHSLTHLESFLPSLNPEFAPRHVPAPRAERGVRDPVLL